MAHKDDIPEGVDNLDLDNLDKQTEVDSDFDFDFEEDQPKGDRQPIDDIKKGVSESLSDGFDLTKVGSNIDTKFPNTTKLISTATDTVSDIDRMRTDVVKDIAPTINQMKITGRRLLPKVKGILPENVYGKVYDKLKPKEEELNREDAIEKGRSEHVSQSIAAIFNAQQNQALEDKKEQKTTEYIDRSIGESRHSDITHLLSSVKSYARVRTEFTQTALRGYLMKSLELKYKHLYVAKDTLGITKALLKVIENKLESIKYNTALPDFVKKRSIEAFKEHQRNVLMGKATETIGDYTKNFRTKLMSNIGKKVKDTTNSLIGNLNTVNDMGDMYANMSDMNEEFGEKQSTLTKLSKFAGSTAIGMGIKKGINKATSVVGQYGGDVEKASEGVRRKAVYNINDYVKNSDNPIVNWLSDLIPTLEEERGNISKTLKDNALEEVPFDVLTRRSIIEVIPGYLAKILQQTTNIATGTSDTEELTYDLDSESFMGLSEAKSNMMHKIFGTAEDRKAEVEEGLQMLLGGYSAHGHDEGDVYDQIPELTKILTNIAKHGKNIDHKQIAKLARGDEYDSSYISSVFKDVENPDELAKVLTKAFYDTSGNRDIDVTEDLDAFTKRLAIDRDDKLLKELDQVGGLGNKQLFGDILDKDGKVDHSKIRSIYGDISDVDIDISGANRYKDKLLQNHAGRFNSEQNRREGTIRSEGAVDADRMDSEIYEQMFGKDSLYGDIDQPKQKVSDEEFLNNVYENDLVKEDLIDQLRKTGNLSKKDVTKLLSGKSEKTQEQIVELINQVKLSKMNAEFRASYDSGDDALFKDQDRRSESEIIEDFLKGTDAVAGVLKKASTKLTKSFSDFNNKVTEATGIDAKKTIVTTTKDLQSEAQQRLKDIDKSIAEATGIGISEKAHEGIDYTKKKGKEAQGYIKNNEMIQQGIKQGKSRAKNAFQHTDQAYKQLKKTELPDISDTVESTKQFASDKVKAGADHIKHEVTQNEFMNAYAYGEDSLFQKDDPRDVARAKTRQNIDETKNVVHTAVEHTLATLQEYEDKDYRKNKLDDLSNRFRSTYNRFMRKPATDEKDEVVDKTVDTLDKETVSKPEVKDTPHISGPGVYVQGSEHEMHIPLDESSIYWKQLDKIITQPITSSISELQKATVSTPAEDRDELLQIVREIRDTTVEYLPNVGTSSSDKGEGKISKARKTVFGTAKNVTLGTAELIHKLGSDAWKTSGNLAVGASKMIGNSLGGVGKGLGAIGSGMGSIIGSSADVYGNILKGAGSRIKSFLTPSSKKTEPTYINVYRKDEVEPGKPILTARKQRSGVVFEDGNILESTDDITEPIFDSESKEVLITQQDIEHGLVDINNEDIGKAVSKERKSAKGGGIIKKGLSMGLGGLGNIGNLLMGGAGSLGQMYKKMFDLSIGGLKGAGGIVKDKLFGGTKLNKATVQELVTDRLDNIIKILDTRLEKPISGDTDGDGDREGSYQDYMDKKKEKYGGKSTTSRFKRMRDSAKSKLAAAGGLLFGNRKKTDDDDEDGFDMSEVAAGGLGAKAGYDYLKKKFGKWFGKKGAEKTAKTASKTVLKKGATTAAKKSIFGRVGKSLLRNKKLAPLAALAAFAGMNIGDDDAEADTTDSVDLAEHLNQESDVDRDGIGGKTAALGAGTAAAAGLTTRAIAKKATAKSVDNFTTKSIGNGIDAGIQVGSKGIKAASKKLGTKSATQMGTKVVGKTVGKSLLKKIPLLGAVAGLGFGWDRLKDGDILGAVGEVASGVASIIPVFGTAASVAIDGLLLGRDIKNIKSDMDNSPSMQKLTTVRAEAYGIPLNKESLDNMLALEEWLIPLLEDPEPIDEDIMKGWAKKFGFDPDDEKHFNFFLVWMKRRFSPLLSQFYHLLKHGYEMDMNDMVDLNETQTKSIIAQFKKSSQDIVSKNSNLIPTIQGFKLRFDTSVKAERYRSRITTNQSYPSTVKNKTLPRTQQQSGFVPKTNPTIVTDDPMKLLHSRIGTLSARYESGNRGSEAIGYDSTGGTSYGKYQIATATGTFDKFLSWCESQPGGMEVAARLRAAGEANTGTKHGKVPAEWKKLVQEGAMGQLEHEFIKETHYKPALDKINNKEFVEKIKNSKALQDVLWSTSVQHGASGAAKIFNKAWDPKLSDADLVRTIYSIRSTKFGSSTSRVRASVMARFENEKANAIAMLDRADRMRTSVAQTDTTSAPIKTENSIQTASLPKTTHSEIKANRSETTISKSVDEGDKLGRIAQATNPNLTLQPDTKVHELNTKQIDILNVIATNIERLSTQVKSSLGDGEAFDEMNANLRAQLEKESTININSPMVAQQSNSPKRPPYKGVNVSKRPSA